MGIGGLKSHIFKCAIYMNKINISFTGEFHNSLDAKNRINIPAKHRNSLDPSNDRSFVITKGFDLCLCIYPINEWRLVESQLMQLSSIRIKHRNFVRSIVRHASHVQYDSQGRIIIPDRLIEYAQIKKNILIIGMINKIEVWNPHILEKHDAIKKHEITQSDFEDLANEIDF